MFFLTSRVPIIASVAWWLILRIWSRAQDYTGNEHRGYYGYLIIALQRLVYLMQSSGNVIVSQERGYVKLYHWGKHCINYEQNFQLTVKIRLISTHLDKICYVVECP